MTTPSISNLGKGQSQHVLCNNTNPAQTIDCYVSYMITFGTFSRILTELNLRTNTISLIYMTHQKSYCAGQIKTLRQNSVHQYAGFVLTFICLLIQLHELQGLK